MALWSELTIVLRRDSKISCNSKNKSETAVFKRSVVRCLPLKLALGLSLAASLTLGGTLPQSSFADDFDSLRKALEQSRKSGKREEQALNLYVLGQALAEARHLDEALPYLQEALTKDRELNRLKEVFDDLVAIGLVQTHKKDYAAAEATYQEALNFAKSTKQDKLASRAYSDLGANAIHGKQYDKAREYYQSAQSLAHGQNDYVTEAQARLSIAMLLKREGKLDEAITEAEASAALLKNISQEPMVAEVAMHLAELKEHGGDTSGAIAGYQQAAKIFKEAGSAHREGNALLSLANNYLGQGQAKLALSVLNQAHTAFDEEGDQMMLARVMVREGSALADMRNFAEAERMHKDAANLAKTLKDNDVLALALYEQGNDKFMEGAVDKSLTHFMALSDFVKSGADLSDQDIEADTLIGVAQCYSAMGQQAAAIKYYEMAVEKYKKVDNKLKEISTANIIASTYLNFGNTKAYLEKYQQLKAMLDAIEPVQKATSDFKYLAGAIAFNKAQHELITNKYQDAINEYKVCISYFEQSGKIQKLPGAYTGIGLALLDEAILATAKEPAKKEELLKQAISYFEKALPIAKEAGLLEQQWDCAIGLGSCYRIMGDKDKAESNLRKAISLFEKEKNLHSRDDSKTYTLDLRGSSFQELVALLVDQGRLDESLEIAERGRARAFLDLLEGRRTSQSKGLIAQSSTNIMAPEAVSPKSAPAPKPDLIAMAPAMPGPNGVMRSVEVVPRVSGYVLDSTVSDVSAKAPDINEIKELVKQSKSYVVEYFVTGPRLYIFVIDPTGDIKAAKPVEINRVDLTQKVVNAYQAIITPPKDLSDLKASNERRQKYLTDLHTILIDPIQSLLPKDPEQVVTIVPHDALYKVPFAALTAKDGKLLIEDHTLAVIPAVGVFRATHQLLDQANTSNALLAFGNPTLKQVGGLGALPFAEREVKKISDLFGAANCTVRVKDDASGVALRELAPKAAIIHLATHGLIDEERPMDSAVLLAASGSDDGILTVRDILKMPQLKAKLITLSACQTGRGKISGDGVAGLSRAFILAGTPSVLVSLWNVDDVMTEYQMGAFYQSYLAGNNKAKALRDAQIKTLNFMEKGLAATPPGALKVRANPRYWSAFQLVGEYR